MKTNNNKNMERQNSIFRHGRILVAALFLALAVVPASAQVMLLDVEETRESDRIGNDFDDVDLPKVPILDVTYDQYAPLGSGLVLLTALGGAYALAKKRKEE